MLTRIIDTFHNLTEMKKNPVTLNPLSSRFLLVFVKLLNISLNRYSHLPTHVK